MTEEKKLEKAETELQGQDFAEYLAKIKEDKRSKTLPKLKKILIDCTKNGKSFHLLKLGDFPEIKKDQNEKENYLILLNSLKPLEFSEEHRIEPHSCDIDCRNYGCPPDPRELDTYQYYGYDIIHRVAKLEFVGWTIHL
jgi:hypothetical protein